MDDGTRRIHGITTDELADEPTFDAIQPELTRRLRGLDGEHVVLVAHKASADVGVLRHEYKLAGVPLPELPVWTRSRCGRRSGCARPATAWTTCCASWG